MHQNYVDASAVHVDHLESPVVPHKMISRLRQFMQLRDDEAGQGDVVAGGSRKATLLEVRLWMSANEQIRLASNNHYGSMAGITYWDVRRDLAAD